MNFLVATLRKLSFANCKSSEKVKPDSVTALGFLIYARIIPSKSGLRQALYGCARGRVKVASAGRPRRGRRSLVPQWRGETHGKRRPWVFDPDGVEYLFAPCP